MRYYIGPPYIDGGIYHSGILKQKWGVRRYQNPDGTYTEEGKLRKRAYRENLRSIRGDARGEMAREYARKAASVVMNASIKVGKGIITGIKRTFPSLMTEEELYAYEKRLNLQASIKDLKKRRTPQSVKFVRQMCEEGTRIVNKKAVTFAANKLFP